MICIFRLAIFGRNSVTRADAIPKGIGKAPMPAKGWSKAIPKRQKRTAHNLNIELNTKPMITTISPRFSAAASGGPEIHVSREGAAKVKAFRILIVDNDRDLAREISRALRMRGHETKCAHTGVEALKLAHAFQPEFAMVDALLADLSGYEVAALLPAVVSSVRLRTATVSGCCGEDDDCLSQAAGCVFHLRKPLDVAEIETLVTGHRTVETDCCAVPISDAATSPSVRRRVLTPPSSRLRLAKGNMPPALGNSHFPTTRWTGVLQLLGTDDLAMRNEALASLCRDYWYPLYAFARRMGRSQEDAEDLTQGFFAYAIERDVFSLADQDLGTLRTFLLRVFQRYIGDVQDRENAQKRGGGRELVSLNLDGGEELYSHDLATNDTPELVFDRSWAQSLLRVTLATLAASEQSAGREQQFEILQSFLIPDTLSEQCYEDAGRASGLAPEAVRQVVCRLRKKFRECLREQIAATLHQPDNVRIDAELSALRVALRG